MTGRISAVIPAPLAAFLAAMLMAGPGFSEPVKIRSGEHDTFTRIVLDLPKRSEWTLNKSGKDAVLTFTGQKFEFDTGAVFNRLSQGRLGEISGGPGADTLTIKLGCDCDLATFWYGRSSLVVDIRDASDPPQATPVAQAPEQANEPPNLTGAIQTNPPSAPLLTFPDENLSTAASLTMTGFAGNEPAARAEESAPAATNKPDPVTARTPERYMHETRDRLLRQISRAASQGLLSPSVDIPDTSLPPAPPDPSVESETAPVTAASEASTDTADHINLRAQSSIDRDFLSALARASGTSDSPDCISPEQVDVASWGTEEPYASQVGALRLRLSGEFDKTDEDVALKLARLYLYFGFGVEAGQALKLISEKTPDTRLLADLAAIFETGHTADGSQLAGQLTCGAPVSLWSALSYPTLPAGVAMDDNSILLGFNALPPHLRSYLGPVLSRRLLEAGHDATSERILRILDRNKETTTPDADLVRAEMKIAAGAHAEADAILDDVVTTGAGVSAQALLLKIETALEAGDVISYETAQLAGAYAQENRDVTLGHELSQAYVVSLAASGAFDQSYQELKRLMPGLERTNLLAAQSRILGFLSANADDMTFLKHVFAAHKGQPDTLNDGVVNAAAKRLLALGFTTKARQFLTPEADAEHRRMRALLRAELSLKENHPRQAEAALLGLDGEDVNLLLAKARSLIGEHKASAQLFASGNQPSMARREAWLAGDWDMILAADDPVLKDVARMVNQGNDVPQAEGPQTAGIGELAQGRALIAASSSARDTIDALLQAQPGPDLKVQ